MINMNGIGVDILRKEVFDKVSRTAKYTDDTICPGILHIKLLTSSYAHANIKSIDIDGSISLPQFIHAAIKTRNVRAQIMSD